MISFEVNYGDLKGGQRIRESRIRELFKRAESVLKDKVKKSVSIAFVGASDMKRLNEEYHGGRGVTDVLSFPAEGLAAARGYLGEILIHYPRAKSQADSAGRKISEEVELLIVHGLLHLMGYDHRTSKEQTTMFRLQERITDI